MTTVREATLDAPSADRTEPLLLDVPAVAEQHCEP
jgi:hypothetical protein